MDSGPMRIRFAAGVSKNVDLRGPYIKQGLSAACVKVTIHWDRYRTVPWHLIKGCQEVGLSGTG